MRLTLVHRPVGASFMLVMQSTLERDAIDAGVGLLLGLVGEIDAFQARHGLPVALT